MSEPKKILTEKEYADIWRQNIKFLRSANNHDLGYFIFFITGFILFSLFVDQIKIANIIFTGSSLVYLTGWCLLTYNLKNNAELYTPNLAIYTAIVVLWLIVMIPLDWLFFQVPIVYHILYMLCCIFSIIIESSFFIFYKRVTPPWPKKVLLTNVIILVLSSLLMIMTISFRCASRDQREMKHKYL